MFVVSEPRAVESVSKLVSEPGAVAMGSNNSAKLDDPVATALGSDTESKRRVGSRKHSRRVATAENSSRILGKSVVTTRREQPTTRSPALKRRLKSRR